MKKFLIVTISVLLFIVTLFTACQRIEDPPIPTEEPTEEPKPTPTEEPEPTPTPWVDPQGHVPSDPEMLGGTIVLDYYDSDGTGLRLNGSVIVRREDGSLWAQEWENENLCWEIEVPEEILDIEGELSVTTMEYMEILYVWIKSSLPMKGGDSYDLISNIYFLLPDGYNVIFEKCHQVNVQENTRYFIANDSHTAIIWEDGKPYYYMLETEGILSWEGVNYILDGKPLYPSQYESELVRVEFNPPE